LLVAGLGDWANITLSKFQNVGFGYAIIGGVGPAAYYSKAVGAVPIEGSEPGVYRGLLDS